MNGNDQSEHIVEPDTSELQLASRAFSLQEGANRPLQPAQATPAGTDSMQHFLVLIGHASARLNSGATAHDAIADLVSRGLDRDTAQVVVDKAADVVASNRALESAPPAQHVRARSGKSIRVFAIVLVVVALVVALLVMR